MEVACLHVYFILSVSVVWAVQIYVKESQILLTFSISLPLENTEESQTRSMVFMRESCILDSSICLRNSCFFDT